MYKRFALALTVTMFCTSFSTFAQIEDTQIIDREKSTEESSVSFQKFSSCESMDTVLKKYFKELIPVKKNLQSLNELLK